MPFIELVYQAEVSRYEDEDFAELARRICNEDPDTRSKKIAELRSLIYERGQCNPRRLDDAYLLRFLRGRRFVPAHAHKLMVRYEQFRRDYAYLYDCDLFSLGIVKNVFSGTVPDSPRNGRILVVSIGNFDCKMDFRDAFRAVLVLNEVTVMQPKMQILGTTVIMDLEGMTFSHMRLVTPTAVRQAAALAGFSFPLVIHAIHIVNFTPLISKVFRYMLQRFSPNSFRNAVFFHDDVASLHDHIDLDVLPPQYGGRSQYVVKFEDWLLKIKEYKDDFMTQELRDLGFNIDGHIDESSLRSDNK